MADLNPLAFQQAQQAAIGVADNVRQNRLQQFAMQRAEDQYQQEQAANRLYAAAVGPDGTIDRIKLVTGFAQGGLGSKIPALQTQFSAQDKSLREADKAKLESIKQHVELQGQLLGGVRDQASYDQARQMASQSGIDISQLPPQYDPAFVQQAQQKALSASQQVDQMWKQRGYDLDQQKFAYQQQNDSANRGVQLRGQDLSADTARRGQDVTVRGQDMTDTRAREANAAKAAADKAPTEFQSKAALFGARAEEADRILNDLAKQGVERPGVIKQIAGGVPVVGGALEAGVNALPGALGGPSAGQQQVEQARRDFVNAVLRQESGAVIGESEFRNAERQYFPQIGDTPQVIAQKAANRRTAIEGLKRGAGKAAYSADGSKPKPSLSDIFGN
jgi:hypothetical protein